MSYQRAPYPLLLGAVFLAAAAGWAVAGDWSQWRGPDRTNGSTETGLLKEWPKEGPPLVWKAQGLGQGVPPISVAAGRIFTLGYRGPDEFAIALAARDGKPLWSTRVGLSVPEAGGMRWLSQRSPTVDGDRLYAVTVHGELVCLGVRDGKERWRKSYPKDFGGQSGPWGFCDFPLVDGDKLICTPGGDTATVVAVNKKTGEVLWQCAVPGAPTATEGPGVASAYTATVVAEVGGIRQYLNQFSHGTVGVAARGGKFLWHYSYRASAN